MSVQGALFSIAITATVTHLMSSAEETDAKKRKARHVHMASQTIENEPRFSSDTTDVAVQAEPPPPDDDDDHVAEPERVDEFPNFAEHRVHQSGALLPQAGGGQNTVPLVSTSPRLAGRFQLSTAASLQPPPGAQISEIAFDMDFNAVRNSQEAFKQRFINSVAAATSVSPDRLYVEALTPGSVVVKFRLLPATLSMSASFIPSSPAASDEMFWTRVRFAAAENALLDGIPVKRNIDMESIITVGADGKLVNAELSAAERDLSPSKLSFDSVAEAPSKIALPDVEAAELNDAIRRKQEELSQLTALADRKRDELSGLGNEIAEQRDALRRLSDDVDLRSRQREQLRCSADSHHAAMQRSLNKLRSERDTLRAQLIAFADKLDAANRVDRALPASPVPDMTHEPCEIINARPGDVVQRDLAVLNPGSEPLALHSVGVEPPWMKVSWAPNTCDESESFRLTIRCEHSAAAMLHSNVLLRCVRVRDGSRAEITIPVVFNVIDKKLAAVVEIAEKLDSATLDSGDPGAAHTRGPCEIVNAAPGDVIRRLILIDNPSSKPLMLRSVEVVDAKRPHRSPPWMKVVDPPNGCPPSPTVTDSAGSFAVTVHLQHPDTTLQPLLSNLMLSCRRLDDGSRSEIRVPVVLSVADGTPAASIQEVKVTVPVETIKTVARVHTVKEPVEVQVEKIVERTVVRPSQLYSPPDVIEKRVEVPKEIVREVEKIVEVPKEVIREVHKEVVREVERIVEVPKEVV